MRTFGIGRFCASWVIAVQLRTPMRRARPRSPLRAFVLFAFFTYCSFFGANSKGGVFFDPYRMSNKSREAKHGRLRQIARMRRTHGAESDWSTLPGASASSLGVIPVPPPLPDLGDPELCLDFFGQAFNFAVFPNKSRLPLAIGSGVNSKSKAWEWTCGLICVDALRPQWIHRPEEDQSGILFADLPHEIGDCR